MAFGNFLQVWRDDQIFGHKCWFASYPGPMPGWMHTHSTLLGLLWDVFKEYKHDRHLVG